ncbi:MAG: hypothetical protein A2176_15020 [Spirochaetes bacterium RBG_13_51_14]|nr:MAG: hypothetical protein A2176_15020 [Spirochaetes bacterium RBG_13_51_14]
MRMNISVRIKFFSGIDKELKLNNYNPTTGITMDIPSGKRLKWTLKTAGMKTFSNYAFFRNGERIGLWAKLRDGDEVSCLKPSGGG